MFPLKDNLECKTFPYVTVALILLNCLVTIWQTTMQAYTGSEAFHGPFWLLPSELIQPFGSGDGLAVVRETFTLFGYQFPPVGLMASPCHSTEDRGTNPCSGARSARVRP